MIKARDIMTTDVITVSKNTSTFEAMKLMVKNNITGLPVVSDDMRLLGIVSEKDMLKLLYSPQSEPQSVAECMTSDVVSFDENEELTDVCECLIKNNFMRVPILSVGKLAGIISRRDIIKFILKVREK